VLLLDFSFTKLDTLRCCDCTTPEQQFSEADHDANSTRITGSSSFLHYDAIIDGWIQHREETIIRRDNQILQSSTLSVLEMRPAEFTDIQYSVVREIISQHSAILQTLTYLTPIHSISFHIFGHLPHLKDLTIVCLCIRSTSYEVDHNNPLHRLTQFPSLERLHLSYFYTKPLFRHDEFRRVAPNLRYLRLSGRIFDSQFEKLHPQAKVLVQTISVSSREQRVGAPHLRGFLSDQRHRERIVLLEPGHREDGRYGFFDALLVWLDVSTGGNGFWGATDQIMIDGLAAR
jgi:hypothetical protein